jgi:hypothetical protein
MIPQGYQGLVAKAGRCTRGDAVVHEKDGFVPDIPGLQEPWLGLGKAGMPATATWANGGGSRSGRIGKTALSRWG